MRKVLLYGELAKRFGREHHFSVRSAGEAVQALCVNFPELKTYMRNAHKTGVGFKVFVGKNSLKHSKEKDIPTGDSETIRIAPALIGSGAVTRIIIGAVLVIAGAVLTILSDGAGSPAGAYMMQIGAALILGGVVELLAPSPKTPSQAGTDSSGQSFIFSGPENVTQQGGAVPLCYGRMMVGSTVISAGIEDEDQ